MRDLEGIQVVSLEQAVAAPYASGRLADAGARVIKVERPQGDFARRYDALVQGESAYFVWLNRGKESLPRSQKPQGSGVAAGHHRQGRCLHPEPSAGHGHAALARR
jgi:CoA-transferase family III